MANDNNRKSRIKYEDTTYLMVDERIPDIGADDDGKSIVVNNGSFVLANGGMVSSVNGQTGAVTITADSIGAQSELTAGNNITIHNNVITATVNDSSSGAHPLDSEVLLTAMVNGCDLYDIASTINITGYIKYADGTEANDTNGTYRRSPYIFFPKGTRLHINGICNSTSVASVAFYDTSKTYIGDDGYSIAGNTLSNLQNFIYVMPSDGYIRFSCHNDEVSDVTVRNIPKEKELNILVLGNSFSQDAFAYLPPILNEMLPDYGITYGVAYGDSYGAEDHVNSYENDVKYEQWNLWRSGADHWSHYTGSSVRKSMKDILGLYDWDIVYFQSNGTVKVSTMESSMKTNNITPGRKMLRILQDELKHPFMFLTGQWVSTVYDDAASTAASYERMRNAIKYVGDNLGVNDIVPVGAAVSIARTNSTLDALGNAGHLLYNTHMQAGLPALMSSYVIAEYLVRKLGRSNCSVYGSSFVPSGENCEAINSSSMTHGTPVGVETDYIRAAQEIAVAAVTHPDVFMDCSDILESD